MLLIVLALMQFHNPAPAQDLNSDLSLDHISSDTYDMVYRIGKMKQTKCGKRSKISEHYNQDQINYTVYLVNGKAQCSAPMVEKYCVISHSIKMRDYDQMDRQEANLCRLAYARNEGDQYSLHFEKTYCPEVTCYTSWLDTVTFSDFTVGNFKYNVGKFLYFRD
jgi:hypothetical protein